MFGNVLRNARLEADLTQEKLAFKAGVDRTYISHLENDKKSPTLDMLFRLCDALGVSAAAVVARVEEFRSAARKRKKRGKS